jgi:hypothetical protein
MMSIIVLLILASREIKIRRKEEKHLSSKFQRMSNDCRYGIMYLSAIVNMYNNFLIAAILCVVKKKSNENQFLCQKKSSFYA